MDLMKDLMTLSTPVAEGEYTHDFARNKRFKTIMAIVDKELEHLMVIGKPDSNFAKLVTELGGDAGILKEIQGHLDALEEAFADLEMTVGIAKEQGK